MKKLCLSIFFVAVVLWLIPSRFAVAAQPTPTSGATLTCPSAADLQSLGFVEQWLYENQILSGAQISFLSDFSASLVSWGRAIDSIQYQGNNVTSVPAGAQASIWIKPACRPSLH